jgi:hypothetical protein
VEREVGVRGSKGREGVKGGGKRERRANPLFSLLIQDLTLSHDAPVGIYVVYSESGNAPSVL